MNRIGTQLDLVDEYGEQVPFNTLAAMIIGYLKPRCIVIPCDMDRLLVDAFNDIERPETDDNHDVFASIPIVNVVVPAEPESLDTCIQLLLVFAVHGIFDSIVTVFVVAFPPTLNEFGLTDNSGLETI